MKKVLGYFIALVTVMSLSSVMVSCGDDGKDEPNSTTTSIVGTWQRSEVETEDGITYNYVYTFIFDRNGTGVDQTEVTSSAGVKNSYSYPFHYTLSNSANGSQVLTLQYDDENSPYTASVSRTGNTLVIGNYVYTKK